MAAFRTCGLGPTSAATHDRIRPGVTHDAALCAAIA
jgi:hypothetical protein